LYQKVVPPRKKPKNDKGYFEILSKAVFNAGFSYQVVRNKWKGTMEVFHEFNYLNSFRDNSYEEKQKVLSRQFKWLGPGGAHFFLWSIGENAPPCEQEAKLN